ncbi:MAG: elongation factor P [Buchnera aphidicola (Periphyllus lyropictus)]|uniref:elongation factor P n=1 Tax=Buchnera aphidicola TaxID=9 RepID=UPI001ED57238|nr:elongation factor P [Buchnera aphidicola]NIH16786.1 elongation factor P [Buchnera aphidicola (Periphyllus lyropictus)]USS94682.1 elongation factor P [Buchnera aphidicola (Periphyllus lyropictus)]
MSKNYSINMFKPGLKVIIFKEPCIIKSSFFVKPGKGQAFSRLKFKSLLSGKIVETTFKSTDRLEKAEIKDLKAIYLYNNHSFWYFMDNTNFNEIIVSKDLLKNTRFWLIPQCKCVLTIWKKEVISVSVDNFVNLTVIKTSPSIKKNSINNSIKLAILNTGISVKVPYFIKNNDLIKVDTRTSKYVSRIK